MRIAIGSDHAGFDYKQRLLLFLIESGHLVSDFGTFSDQPVDYPRWIRPVAEAVAAGEFDRGIVLGGSGNGEAIVANRVPGIRCTLCWNLESARFGREHNDANVLSLGQRMMDFEEAQSIVELWLETPFQGGRHTRRIHQIDRPRKTVKRAERGGRIPHRAVLIESAGFTCQSCGEEFSIPIDLSAGAMQEFVEECPVCCHENAIHVAIDDEGDVSIHGDTQVP